MALFSFDDKNIIVFENDCWKSYPIGKVLLQFLDDDLESSGRATFYLTELQTQYQHMVTECLDADQNVRYKGLTPEQRFYVVMHLSHTNIPTLLESMFAVSDRSPQQSSWGIMWENKLTINELYGTNPNVIFISDKTSREIFDYSPEERDQVYDRVLKASPKLHQGCKVNNLAQRLAMEFINMVSLNMNVRRCGMCCRYFILKGKHDAKYCSRIYKSSKRTCQQVAASEKHEMSISKDEVEKAYKRAYKRNYNMMKRNPTIYQKDDFEHWKKVAQSIRDQYITKSLSQKEAVNKLNSSNMI